MSGMYLTVMIKALCGYCGTPGIVTGCDICEPGHGWNYDCHECEELMTEFDTVNRGE